ncbi:hypothetical protein [Paraburkholderia rhizosphaerae]|uniref:Uncharacterized protein n=1 Tax=Paraburkholderia rhizosphaerae TaxID=480658 RepID=A0A4R8LX26_9BURK|nr:hypothetical protein [Paraburkholderia rhizosphaerae]TDY52212.1 hypothetical protein BX592_10596 [Paraburkholderia rhizosphaerae]
MKKVVWAGLLTLCLAACNKAAPSGTMTGTYGYDDHGTVTPLLKVESQGNSYAVSEYAQGKWSPVASTIKPFTKEDLEQITKHKIDVPVDGLETNGFALVHVPNGWTDGSFATKTGYFVLMMYGPIDVQKM